MPTQRHEEKKEREKERDRKHGHRRERPPALWLLFLYVFFSSPGPALRKSGQPEVLFVPPEVLTSVLGPSLVLLFAGFPLVL